MYGHHHHHSGKGAAATAALPATGVPPWMMLALIAGIALVLAGLLIVRWSYLPTIELARHRAAPAGRFARPSMDGG